jgi:hypothetical protein
VISTSSMASSMASVSLVRIWCGGEQMTHARHNPIAKATAIACPFLQIPVAVSNLFDLKRRTLAEMEKGGESGSVASSKNELRMAVGFNLDVSRLQIACYDPRSLADPETGCPSWQRF